MVIIGIVTQISMMKIILIIKKVLQQNNYGKMMNIRYVYLKNMVIL